MRPGQQQQQNKRMRGRGRKGPNPLSRSYESNGPDVKIRGTAQHVAEKYSMLARDAAASGDRVMAENYLQHAEHYGRIVAAAQGSFQLQQDDNDFIDQSEDDEIEEGGSDGAYSAEQSLQPSQRAPQERPQQQDRNGQDRQGERHQPAGRDGQNYQREARDNREPAAQGGNRDGQGAYRDGRPRDNRDGNRDRNGNRDGNRDNRDGYREFNRDARDNRGNSGPREGQQPREHQGQSHPAREPQNRESQNRDQRERAAPVDGLGPQPFVAEPMTSPASVVEARGPEARRDPLGPPPTVAPSDGGTNPLRADAPRAEGEPRRRGRPRRIRVEDAAAGYAAALSEPEPEAPAELPFASGVSEDRRPSDVASAPAIESAGEPAETAALPSDDPGVETEAKIKRKPGRPRKKKPDEGGPDEGGGEHMPAFLRASNG